jgi:hypothetical protein
MVVSRFFLRKTENAFLFRTGGLRTMENRGEGCKKGLGKSRGRVKKTAEIQGVG